LRSGIHQNIVFPRLSIALAGSSIYSKALQS
jgi:hypothetical protein